MNTFDLALDLDKRAGVTQWVTLRQGDHNGTVLKATIYDHGVQVGGGYTCRVSIRIAGSGDEYYRETANYSNGVATVTIDEQYAAAVVGITYGYFELLQGSAVIASTESFGVRVLQSAQEGAVPGDKYDSAIEDALAELDEATGHISQMVVDATEEYLEAHPEITTTVQDNSLTDAKLVQRGGILSRVERLWYRLANLLTATPAEADVLTVPDAAKTPLAGLSLYGRSTQDGTPTPDAPVAIQSVGPNPVGTTTWTIGGIDGGTGAVVASNTRIYTDMMPVVGSEAYTLTFDNKDTYDLEVYQYAADGSYNATTTAWRSSPYTLVLSGTTAFVRLLAHNKANTTINPSAAASFRARLFRGAFPVPFVASAGVWAKGRNLLPRDAGFWRNNGIDGATGGYGTDNVARASTDTIPVLPSTTYTISAASGTRFAVYQYTADGGYIRVTYGWWTVSHSFTTQAGTAGLRVLISNPDDSTVSLATIADRRLQIERGSTATPYQPYAESVTPIDLQGHVLRSLPDGTRDEVTVDEYGHAVLVQRVGHIVLDGTTVTVSKDSGNANGFYRSLGATTLAGFQPAMSDRFAIVQKGSAAMVDGESRCSVSGGSLFYLFVKSGLTTAAEANTWLQSNPVTVLYPLATPQTIDLGTVDPIPLQGPDMTAQAVPTAPFELTYERDLNVTLARLEASIAEVATA